MKDARERKSIKRLASLLIFAAGLFLFTACGGPETAPPYLGTYMDADGGRIVVDETGVTVNGATHAYTATESGGVWTLAAGTETLYVFDGGTVLCADEAPIDTGGHRRAQRILCGCVYHGVADDNVHGRRAFPGGRRGGRVRFAATACSS